MPIDPRKLGDAVRHAGTALVEHHHAGIACEPKQPTRDVGFIPPVLHVGDEWRGQNHIHRAAAKHLIGDMNLAALGILGNGLHFRIQCAPRLRLRSTLRSTLARAVRNTKACPAAARSCPTSFDDVD